MDNKQQMTWLLSRLREPSTYRGIVWLLTAAGVALTPEQGEAIFAAGMAFAGLLGVFLQDERNPLPQIETVIRHRDSDIGVNAESVRDVPPDRNVESGWNG